MKLHYVALRKDMFLYMDILYTYIFEVYFRGGLGGGCAVTARWSKMGYQGTGSLYLRGAPPLSARQLTSCSLCRILSH